MTLTENSPWRRRMRWCVGALLALLTSAAIGLYILLHGSLPLLDGTTTLSGLNALVAIERDALGIPPFAAQTGWMSPALRALSTPRSGFFRWI